MSCKGIKPSVIAARKAACVDKGKNWIKKSCECVSNEELNKAAKEVKESLSWAKAKKLEEERMERVMNAPRGTKPITYK